MVVSGGYCQHTEGFGEMAEELSPLAVALSELELRSPHPAGAPRRPPEPACRGEPSIHLDTGRPCVTRSSTLRCRRSVTACLLLLPALRRLLRCRFLRFSLLRHCCPPSL